MRDMKETGDGRRSGLIPLTSLHFQLLISSTRNLAVILVAWGGGGIFRFT